MQCNPPLGRFRALLLCSLFLLQTAFAARAEDAQIPASPAEVRPLLVGAEVPAISLKAVDGSPFDLNAAIAEKPVILIFYRGGWCPYCNTQLSELRTIEGRLSDMGYRLLAASADPPPKSAETREKQGMDCTLLSDYDMAAAKAFGIAYRLDDKTVERYTKHGIGLTEGNLMPVPAVFIIGTEGRIAFQYVNPDYRTRLSSAVLLAAAEAAMAAGSR